MACRTYNVTKASYEIEELNFNPYKLVCPPIFGRGNQKSNLKSGKGRETRIWRLDVEYALYLRFMHLTMHRQQA